MHFVARFSYVYISKKGNKMTKKLSRAPFCRINAYPCVFNALREGFAKCTVVFSTIIFTLNFRIHKPKKLKPLQLKKPEKPWEIQVIEEPFPNSIGWLFHIALENFSKKHWKSGQQMNRRHYYYHTEDDHFY